MSDFKANMHQIRFWLGLCPRPCLQRSPDPLAGFKGPTSKGREGREKEQGRGGKSASPIPNSWIRYQAIK